MKRTLSAALSLLLAVSASAQAPAASLLTKIGTAAAVRGSVKAISSGNAVGHVIASGKPLFLNDHVTTDAAGRLQVLLVDETIFTLGPNSDMVLDEFVYDPKTSAGKMTASISKGTFRFVTGKIAQKDPSSLKIKVAVGTIGVRGSIGVGETGPGGTTIINGGARVPDNHDDAAGIYAQSNGKTVNLIQPGVGTHIGPDGIVEKARFMTDDLNRIMGTLQSKVGQTRERNAAVMAGRTASSASGRSTSVGGLLAAGAEGFLSDASQADIITTLALQAAAENDLNSNSSSSPSIPNGVSSWSQVEGLTGTGTYIGTGNYAGSSGSGSMVVVLDVNFTAQTLGSASSSITLSGALVGSTAVNPFSYSGFTGLASGLNIESHLSNTTLFQTSSLTLNNASGIAAKTAVISANVWTGAGIPSSASATATR
jgi:hypothetical protein